MDDEFIPMAVVLASTCISSCAFFLFFLYVVHQNPSCHVFVTTFYVEILALDVAVIAASLWHLLAHIPASCTASTVLLTFGMCQQVFVCTGFIVYLHRTASGKTCSPRDQVLYHTVPWLASVAAAACLFLFGGEGCEMSPSTRTLWWVFPLTGYATNAFLIAIFFHRVRHVAEYAAGGSRNSRGRLARLMVSLSIVGGIMRIPLLVFDVAVPSHTHVYQDPLVLLVVEILCALLASLQTPALVILYLYNKQLSWCRATISRDTSIQASTPAQLSPTTSTDQMTQVGIPPEAHVDAVIETLHRASLQLSNSSQN